MDGHEGTNYGRGTDSGRATCSGVSRGTIVGARLKCKALHRLVETAVGVVIIKRVVRQYCFT